MLYCQLRNHSLCQTTFLAKYFTFTVDFYTRGAVVVGGFPTNTLEFYNGQSSYDSYTSLRISARLTIVEFECVP